MGNDMKKNLAKYKKNMTQKCLEKVQKRSYRVPLTALENSLHYF